MKASEIRALNQDERKTKVGELEQELFNLRFQREIGQLENMAIIKKTKRLIARLKTVIREDELTSEN